MTGPAVRARHPKFVLAYAAELADPCGRDLLTRVGPEIAAQVAEATPLTWLPVELDVSIDRAIHGALGAEGARGFHRALFQRAFRSPILRPVLEGAMGLFGFDPGSWARAIPVGWSVMFRECGAWRIEPDGPGRVDLFLEGLPPPCLQDPIWLDAVAAFYSAMFDLGGVQGQVERILFEPATGSAVMAVLWQADALPRSRRAG